MLPTQHATPVKIGLVQWDSNLLVAAMNKLNNLPSKHSSTYMASQSRCCTITFEQILPADELVPA